MKLKMTEKISNIFSTECSGTVMIVSEAGHLYTLSLETQEMTRIAKNPNWSEDNDDDSKVNLYVFSRRRRQNKLYI